MHNPPPTLRKPVQACFFLSSWLCRTYSTHMPYELIMHRSIIERQKDAVGYRGKVPSREEASARHVQNVVNPLDSAHYFHLVSTIQSPSSCCFCLVELWVRAGTGAPFERLSDEIQARAISGWYCVVRCCYDNPGARNMHCKSKWKTFAVPPPGASLRRVTDEPNGDMFLSYICMLLIEFHAV